MARITLIAGVGDIHCTRRIHRNRFWVIQARQRGRSTIASAAWETRAGNAGDHLGLHVDLANAVVEAVGDQQISGVVESNIYGGNARCRRRSLVIACVNCGAP